MFRNNRTRLVTLIGLGGVGKTRLALKVADGLAERFRDGISFVPLAAISDPQAVVTPIAQALGVNSTGYEPLLQRIKNALRDKHMLLVLDNFEQIIEAGVVIAELLQAAPGLCVLVTSRFVLHLSGEQSVVVEPLALPDPQHMPDTAKLQHYPAVDLFVQRVQKVTNNFQLTDANADAVAQICVRLEGMPLALEIAAARSKLLTPQELLKRLQNRLDFLTIDIQDLPERQLKLRATLEWTYELLTAAEQTLFRRLAIFNGGHTVIAAEAICGDSRLFPDVLAGLQSLADRSLLRASGEVHGQARLTMMETVHEFALELLRASGELETIQQRHAEYFLAVAEEAYRGLIGPGEGAWLDRLNADHDNLRKALEWSIAQRATACGLRIAVALRRFWVLRGFVSEGTTWFDRLLLQAEATSVKLPAQLIGHAYASAGNLAHHNQDHLQARQRLNYALEFLTDVGASKERAWALANIGWLAMDEGLFVEAAAHFEQGLALSQAVHDLHGCAELLSFQGYLEYRQRRLDTATQLFTASLMFAEEVGDSRCVADALYELADIARDQGNYERAWKLYPRCVEIFRQIGDRERIAWCLHAQSEMALLQTDYERARVFNQESLSLFEDLGHRFGQALVLHNRGYIELRQESIVQAIVPFMSSLALFHAMRNTWGLALTLTGPARIAVESEPGPDGARRAAILLGAAEAVRESIGAQPSLFHDREIRQTIARANEYLDRSEFASAWSQGRELSSDQAFFLAQNGAAAFAPQLMMRLETHQTSLN